MAATKGDSPPVKTVQINFAPSSAGCWTYADVVVTEWSGARRVDRRVGSIRLGIGRRDLVGLTASEMTYCLVEEFWRWLSEERASLREAKSHTAGQAKPPAPPEGVTGAVLKGTVDNPLPGL